MNELLRFKKNAIRLGLCDEYKGKWDSCKSLKDLMDIALSANGIEFTADSVSFGWGMDTGSLANDFHDYVNGQYQRIKDGYTSEMYVSHSVTITLRSTLTLIVGCDVEVKLPAVFAGALYVAGDSHVRLMPPLDGLHGSLDVMVYGDSEFSLLGPNINATINLSEVKQSEWLGRRPVKAR